MSIRITLSFRPHAVANIWDTLIAPIIRVCLVWGETVAIYKTRVVLVETMKKILFQVVDTFQNTFK